jgi:hypothetical protein
MTRALDLIAHQVATKSILTMSLPGDDRLLWLTVAIGLATACLYIPATLERVRTLTEVHSDKDDAKQLSNNAEAALRPDTLRVLADGPSYELRASAIKIVATRCLQDDTRKILLRDLAGKNADARLKAINVISMMFFTHLMPIDHPMAALAAFCDLAGFAAIIDALVNCLPLHDVAASPSRLRKPTQVPARGISPVSPLLPPNRPADERRLMDILCKLLSYDMMATDNNGSIPLQAGIISRWLSIYPFPCAQPSNSHLGFTRSDTVSLFAFGIGSWANDDPPMAKIINALCRDPDALKQLRDCGLKASSYREGLTSTHHNNNGWSEPLARDVLMHNSEDTAGVLWGSNPLREEMEAHRAHANESLVHELITGRPSSSRAWARHAPERSPEEDNLRRRHREAIVVAERGAPFTRENILQRQNSQVGLMPLQASQPTQELLRVFTEDVEMPLRRAQGRGS